MYPALFWKRLFQGFSMRSSAFLRTASVALACAVLAACSDGTSPKPSIVTVDTLLAEVNIGQGLGNAASGLAGVPMSTGLIRLGQDCPYNSVSQSFVCPARTTEGLTFDFYFQLFDASNVPQSAFNPATTAAIRTVSDIAGTIAPINGLPSSTMTLTAHNDQTLSGLLTETHTLNGTGNSAVSSDVGDGPITVTTATTISNLVLPQRGSAKRYPQSGSISSDITSELGPIGSFTMNFTMTFNGTSTVTVTITSDGTTETCTFDLENPTSGTC
jgi:hypothetical protein